MKKLLSLAAMALSLVAFTSSMFAADQVVTKKQVKTDSNIVYDVDVSPSGVMTITGVSVAVKNAAGETVLLPVSAPSLVGGTITTRGSTISITPNNSSTALTPAALVNTLQAAVTTAFNQAVSGNVIPASTPRPVINASTIVTGNVVNLPSSSQAPAVVNLQTTPPVDPTARNVSASN